MEERKIGQNSSRSPGVAAYALPARARSSEQRCVSLVRINRSSRVMRNICNLHHAAVTVLRGIIRVSGLKIHVSDIVQASVSVSL